MDLRKVIEDYLDTNCPTIGWRVYRQFLTGSELRPSETHKRCTKIVTIGFRPNHITINSDGKKTSIIQYYDPALPECILAEVNARHKIYLARRKFRAEYITIQYLALKRQNLQFLADAYGAYDSSSGEYYYDELLDKLIEDRCRSFAEWRTNQTPDD